MKNRGKDFDDLIVKLYAEMHSAYKVADRLGVSHKYVYRILKQREAPIPGWSDEKPHKRAIPAELEATVLADYEEGMTFKKLSEKYGCGDWALRYLVKRSGAKRRSNGGQLRKLTAMERDEIIRLYVDANWPQAAIGAKFNMSQIVISRFLRSQGIDCGAKAGEEHGSWKGGLVETQGGYLQRLVPPDHEFASMRTVTGYILEHRLVMAKHLGRPLYPTETVHHIDGNTKNNNIDNLQLRQGLHGKGVVMRCKCCGSYDVESVKIANPPSEEVA